VAATATTPATAPKRHAAKKVARCGNAAGRADTAATTPPRKGKAAKNAAAAAPGAGRLRGDSGGRASAIQADLALLGDFDANETKDYEARTIARDQSVSNSATAASRPSISQRESARAGRGRQGAAKQAAGWQVIDDAATGARFGLPTKLVPQAGHDPQRHRDFAARSDSGRDLPPP